MQSNKAVVVARFKPITDDQFFPYCDVSVDDNNTIIKTSSGVYTVKKLFRDVPQRDFWEDCVEPLAQRALEGFNSSVLCYGYTGSGKTYSVFGNNDGIAFQCVSNLLNNSSITNLEIKIVEVYLDRVLDLIDVKNNPVLDSNGGLQGVTSVPLTSEEQAYSILLKVDRKTQKNNIHDQSSRSHCIIILKVETASTVAEMYLVDLAGCERISHTSNDLLIRESQAINKSVFVLNNVVKACAENKKYIPYRDSKITMLLKRAIGGNSSTLIVLCCNCSNINETICTLRFGQRCQQIENKVRQNKKQDVNQYEYLVDLVARLKQDISGLTLRLHASENWQSCNVSGFHGVYMNDAISTNEMCNLNYANNDDEMNADILSSNLNLEQDILENPNLDEKDNILIINFDNRNLDEQKDNILINLDEQKDNILKNLDEQKDNILKINFDNRNLDEQKDNILIINFDNRNLDEQKDNILIDFDEKKDNIPINFGEKKDNILINLDEKKDIDDIINFDNRNLNEQKDNIFVDDLINFDNRNLNEQKDILVDINFENQNLNEQKDILVDINFENRNLQVDNLNDRDNRNLNDKKKEIIDNIQLKISEPVTCSCSFFSCKKKKNIV